jgi:hypothetical protein
MIRNYAWTSNKIKSTCKETLLPSMEDDLDNNERIYMWLKLSLKNNISHPNNIALKILPLKEDHDVIVAKGI